MGGGIGGGSEREEGYVDVEGRKCVITETEGERLHQLD